MSYEGESVTAPAPVLSILKWHDSEAYYISKVQVGLIIEASREVKPHICLTLFTHISLKMMIEAHSGKSPNTRVLLRCPIMPVAGGGTNLNTHKPGTIAINIHTSAHQSISRKTLSRTAN